jgi:N-acetylglutamate synthase-like GNAT family acetyltransferase
MDFLFWCSDTELCPAFNEQDGYVNMNQYSRDIVIKGNHPIPGEPMHVYGGIYTLSTLGIFGSTISRNYLVKACNKNHIFIVAIKSISPRLYETITDETIHAIQHTPIVGCITAKIHNERCIEIDTISSRNNHVGVGTNLMFKLLDVAKECLLNVCLLRSLVSSMGFYMKLGFTYLGTDKKRTPVFAIDLTNLEIQPPRLYLKRKSSTIPVPIDERPLEEVEGELLEMNYELVSRNIPIDHYIEEIGQLKIDESWKFLENGMKMKNGFFIPDKDTVRRLRNIKNARPYMEKVKTYLNMPLRTKSNAKNTNRNSIAKSFKIKTYLHKSLRNRSRVENIV